MKAKSLLALAALIAASCTAQAEMLKFHASLKSSQEVPSNTSQASGLAELWYDTETGNYTAYVTVAGLEAPLSGSHIHEASAGSNGPVTVNFGAGSAYVAAANGFYAGKFSGPYSGNLSKLLSSQAYVNVHSSKFPGGEIRGQLHSLPAKKDVIVNASSRGEVNAGKGRNSTVMTGFVIDSRTQILVRGLGEGLKSFGVKDAMPDTAMELFDSTGKRIATNDDWQSSQPIALGASPFKPFAKTDSAILRTLDPGAYTVQLVSEKSAGVALLEVYGLPHDSLIASLQKTGKFNTLIAAASAAGLVDVLSGPGPFTLMAPTDEAFAKLPAGTVESLLLPENKAALTGILLYHLFPGAVPSSALSSTPINAASLEGSTVRLVVDGAAMANTAKIIEVDQYVTNGVIHIIDSVLLPPAK
jgi:uncharacterized surface protein with fasciclin (FAS1) repeats/Cu/Zn superoxide dismutase